MGKDQTVELNSSSKISKFLSLQRHKTPFRDKTPPQSPLKSPPKEKAPTPRQSPKNKTPPLTLPFKEATPIPSMSSEKKEMIPLPLSREKQTEELLNLLITSGWNKGLTSKWMIL